MASIPASTQRRSLALTQLSPLVLKPLPPFIRTVNLPFSLSSVAFSTNKNGLTRTVLHTTIRLGPPCGSLTRIRRQISARNMNAILTLSRISFMTPFSWFNALPRMVGSSHARSTPHRRSHSRPGLHTSKIVGLGIRTHTIRLTFQSLTPSHLRLGFLMTHLLPYNPHLSRQPLRFIDQLVQRTYLTTFSMTLGQESKSLGRPASRPLLKDADLHNTKDLKGNTLTPPPSQLHPDSVLEASRSFQNRNGK